MLISLRLSRPQVKPLAGGKQRGFIEYFVPQQLTKQVIVESWVKLEATFAWKTQLHDCNRQIGETSGIGMESALAVHAGWVLAKPKATKDCLAECVFLPKKNLFRWAQYQCLKCQFHFFFFFFWGRLGQADTRTTFPVEDVTYPAPGCSDARLQQQHARVRERVRQEGTLHTTRSTEPQPQLGGCRISVEGPGSLTSNFLFPASLCFAHKCIIYKISFWSGGLWAQGHLQEQHSALGLFFFKHKAGEFPM